MTVQGLIEKWRAEIERLRSLPRSSLWKAFDSVRIEVIEEGIRTLEAMGPYQALSLWRNAAYDLMADDSGTDYQQVARFLHASIIREGVRELDAVLRERKDV